MMRRLMILLLGAAAFAASADTPKVCATSDVSSQGLWCKDPYLGLNYIPAGNTIKLACSKERLPEAAIFHPGWKKIDRNRFVSSPPANRVVGLELYLKDTADLVKSLHESNAKQVIEIEVEIDGQKAQMTFAEFKRRVLGDPPKTRWMWSPNTGWIWSKDWNRWVDASWWGTNPMYLCPDGNRYVACQISPE